MIGVALAVLLMRDRSDLRWLPRTVAVGAIGQVVVGAIARHPMCTGSRGAQGDRAG